MKRYITRSEMIFIAGMAALSFLFLVLFSYTTSFLAPDLYQYDSGYFQSIGAEWARHGVIPYRGFFDHKGPLLFFINMIAYSSSFPRMALLLIQTIMMTVTFTICYKALEKRFEKRISIALFLVFVLYYSLTINGGNLTEEYNIPFLMIALIPELEWLMSGKNAHPYRLAFMDGITTGIISMFVMKNAVPIVLLVFMIGIKMIFSKEWKLLFQNIAAGLFGFMLPIIPWVIYFAEKKSVGEFITAVLLYNFSYLEGTSGGMGISARVLLLLIPEMICMAASVIVFFNGRRYAAISIFFMTVGMTWMFVSGAQFKHYFMIGVVLIPVAAIAVFDSTGMEGERDNSKAVQKNFLQVFNDSKSFKKCCYISIVALMALGAVTALVYAPRQFACYTNESREEVGKYVESLKTLVYEVPENEREDIAAYNLTGGQVAFYAANDIPILQRHACLTEFHAQYDETIISEYVHFFEDNKPEWIIMPSSSSSDEVLSYVRSNYDMVDTVLLLIDLTMMKDNDTLELWHRRGNAS